MYEDKELVCKDCGKTFVFSAGEQTGRSLFRILQTGNELVLFRERGRKDEIFHKQFLRIQSLDSR